MFADGRVQGRTQQIRNKKWKVAEVLARTMGWGARGGMEEMMRVVT